MNSIDKFLKDGHVGCVGCAACQNICTQNAIEMRVDAIDGYLPYVIKDECVNCGKCVNTCPALTQKKSVHSPIGGYAAIATDNIRKVSSSGGFFSVVAEEILKSGGVIYGVNWDKNLKAVHTRETRIEEIGKYRYSKYVQSDTSNVFRTVKKI